MVACCHDDGGGYRNSSSSASAAATTSATTISVDNKTTPNTTTIPSPNSTGTTTQPSLIERTVQTFTRTTAVNDHNNSDNNNKAATTTTTTISIALEAVENQEACFQVDQPCTGHAVWFAAQNLSDFIVHDKSLLSSSSTTADADSRPLLQVLELGAGPGLVGITMAKLWLMLSSSSSSREDDTATGRRSGATFLLTDGDEQVVDLLRQNCERNELLLRNNVEKDDGGVAVECQQLVWGKRQAENLLQSRGGDGFNVILGADLIYGRSNNSNTDDHHSNSSSTTHQAGTMVADLFDTVTTLLGDDDDEAVFYLAFTRRDVPIEMVLEVANQRGLVWELQDGYTYDVFDCNTDGQTCFWRDAIYAFRRRRGDNNNGAAAAAEQLKQVKLQQQQDVNRQENK